MSRKLLHFSFEKRSLNTQSNVEIPVSQALASHPKYSTSDNSPQMEFHQTKTRRVKSKKVDLSSIVLILYYVNIYKIILCNKEMKFIERI